MDCELEEILRAFAGETGPASALNPEHCDECHEADAILRGLLPTTVTYEDITERAWVFCYVTDAGLRWLMPGIVRVALDRSKPDPSAVFGLLSQKYDEIFTEEQWMAVLLLADLCVSKGWMERDEADALGPGKCLGNHPPGLDELPRRPDRD